ncbi:Adaptin N terminal region family protein [Trichomonas vaginalis G3]|uniref:Adaptin N terminal region family protein n=1 Tax=Trichomonas vaginalis (strain ATCC PRA-98 / G3) TaxID=412133 RepID=A2DLB3_TRIV3|nr:clathrin binding [Trichomonas vaginalis G3]EAY18731.1 Adaptin N terminal region family protein [Trichomonas vaginalis G3]KAI5510161.1 clathrin binding [Trichomonas vaginalis G3]|eukprot:XP_001579717.1 Adaptin N terminal region family protein [Trichomonas vaginalis G3]
MSNAKTELSETIEKLRSSDEKVALEGLKQLLVLHAQGEDLSSFYKDIALIIPGKSPTIRRYRNIILGDSYTGIGTILADFQSDNYLLQSLSVKRAGLVITAESGDVLIPIIFEAAVSEHPHLRAAAAFAIQKLEKNDTTLIELYKLDQLLMNLLDDPVINVSANAASVMIEINNSRAKPLFVFPFNAIDKLTKAILDATEWCRIQILNLVTAYQFKDKEECFKIIENMQPHLFNANSAVTIGVIRNIIKCFPIIADIPTITSYLQSFIPPLLKLLSASSETKFVVLRQFLILIQNFRLFFIENLNVSSFFCRKEDEKYIQLAKLEVIKLLTHPKNVDTIIDELQNYAKSKNESLGRESVLELGRIAVTFNQSTEKIVSILQTLLKDSSIVIKDTAISVAINIIRPDLSQYFELANKILELPYDEIEDQQTKSALAWLAGECVIYTEIQYSYDIISELAECFMDETTPVKLSILAAIAKFYIVNPGENYNLFAKVFSLATMEEKDPEVRDRAYSYMVILGKHKDIADRIFFRNDTYNIEVPPLENKKLSVELIKNLGSIATVLRKFPAEFDRRNKSDDDIIFPLLLERSSSSFDCELRGQFIIDNNGQRFFALSIKNMGNNPLILFMVSFNVNTLGFTPAAFTALPKIEAKQSSLTMIPVISSAAFVDKNNFTNVIKIEMKVDRPKRISFTCETPLKFLLEPIEHGKINREEFNRVWPTLNSNDETSFVIREAKVNNPEKIKSELEKERVFFFAKKDASLFFSGRTVNDDLFFLIVLMSAENACKISLRMKHQEMRSLILGLITGLFK